MKLGIVIQSSDPETAWNALRFANTAKNNNHDVRVFLLSKGVEIETIRDNRFDVQQQLNSFLSHGGQVLACGTCLEIRNAQSAVCPVSTMAELLKIVEESEKLMVF